MTFCVRAGTPDARHGFKGQATQHLSDYYVKGGKFGTLSQSPGGIQQTDPPSLALGFIIYTIGVLESRIGGSFFGIFPRALGSRVVLHESLMGQWQSLPHDLYGLQALPRNWKGK